MSTVTTQPVLMTAGDLSQELGVPYDVVMDVIEARNLMPVHEGPRRYDAAVIAQVRTALAEKRNGEAANA